MEHLPVSLAVGRGALGLLSIKPPSTGVIFVHGFHGNPVTTWVNFDSLIERLEPHRALWSECDLFFYAYRSQDQVRPLAEHFLEFLSGVAAHKEINVITPDFVFPSTGQGYLNSYQVLAESRGSAPYQTLILVGHSTGAVIIRDALMLEVTRLAQENKLPKQGTRKKYGDLMNKRLILDASLRFFAPAHLGVLAAGKLGFAQSLPIIDRLVALYLRSNPLYQNLRHDSPTILDLRRDTERLYERHKLEALKAVCLFGEHEEIVYIGGYSHDVTFPTEPGHRHTTVCKPQWNYLKPIEFVIDRAAIAKHA